MNPLKYSQDANASETASDTPTSSKTTVSNSDPDRFRWRGLGELAGLCGLVYLLYGACEAPSYVSLYVGALLVLEFARQVLFGEGFRPRLSPVLAWWLAWSVVAVYLLEQIGLWQNIRLYVPVKLFVFMVATIPGLILGYLFVGIRTTIRRWKKTAATDVRNPIPEKVLDGSVPQYKTEVPYRMPARFGLGMLLTLTFLYALLFGVFRATGAPESVPLFIGILLALVAAGQALIYKGERPRFASILVGWAAWSLFLAFLWWHNGLWPFPRLVWPVKLFLFSFYTLPGIGIGYAAGGCVAGIFLVADMAEDYLFARWRRRGSEQPGEQAS